MLFCGEGGLQALRSVGPGKSELSLGQQWVKEKGEVCGTGEGTQ